MRTRRWIGVAVVSLMLSGSSAPGAQADDPVALVGYVRSVNMDIAVIGGETNPLGWLVSHSAEEQPLLGTDDVYLDFADIGGAYGTRGHYDALGARLAAFDGKVCRITGTLTPAAIPAGGVETPLREFDLLRVDTIEVVPDLAQRLRDDLDQRGADYFQDGAAAPLGGLSPTGRCADGRLAAVVALELPPPGTADFFTDLAYVCAGCNCYWAHRSGGFAGVSLWLGPFAFPAAEQPPHRVVPRSLRIPRRRAVTRRLRVRRWHAGPVSADDYATGDFDFGEGVTVLAVRKANGRRIKLRVQVSPDAPLGWRDVRVRDLVGVDLLRLRPPRPRRR